MKSLKKLNKIREHQTEAATNGLSDERIKFFLKEDKDLALAIEAACEEHKLLRKKYPELIKLGEKDLIAKLQTNILNFYQPETVSPYVPIAAKGPWIISISGSVFYDTGGYGMLGFGHDPDAVKGMLCKSHVMANVMTPSFYQHKFAEKLKQHLGFKHKNGCPYEKFICMNSGSEAGTVAARISDANAKVMTDPEGKHNGKTIRFLGLEGSFHGRTMRTARVSHSTLETYRVLASFRKVDNLLTVLPNDIEDLKRVYEEADKNNIYFEAMFLEPVMGEGNPGMAITPEFYDAARKLTREHDTFLVVDSIQAGLRTHGVLSIIDYPGFSDCEPPDMETFSKALNAGQFPLSVLALSAKAAKAYVPGIYGNTMTANPRGLDVACAVLDQLNSDLRRNVEERGEEFLAKLYKLQEEFPAEITKVQGTGLLLSADLTPDIPVVGFDGVEVFMRQKGVNVIHGGKNALRFTPHLAITSAEIDLIIDITREALQSFKA